MWPEVHTQLHTELWTSWASMLRVYAAAHGLTSPHHAVVEVGADEILLRVDTRWARFTHSAMTTSEGISLPFALHEAGTIQIGNVTEEMDFTAERLVRQIFTLA